MTGGWWFMALFYPHYLVGGIPTPLKNMKVSWDDYSQYMEKKNVFPLSATLPSWVTQLRPIICGSDSSQIGKSTT